MSAGPRRLADDLCRPRAVALIGASDDPRRVAGRPLDFLKRHGRETRFYPINSKRDAVQGVKAYRALSDLPEPVDHAYVLLDTEAAMTAVADCAAARVPVVSVLADGFAEAGEEGRARQERLCAIARAGGTRLLGPNSMGAVDLHRGFLCTVNAAFAAPGLRPGRLGVLSQSGSLIGTLLSRGEARGLGFSTLVSLGNEADLGLGEVGAALVDDAETAVFLLFLETIRRPDDIARFAALARARGKPMVAYMLGRSELAAEVAASHTGAIAGSDAAADAFLRHHGIHRVDNFETLLELPSLLLASPRGAGRAKTATVVTTTGGGGAMVVDRLGALGVELRGPDAPMLDLLAAKGIDAKPGRMIDVTLAGTKPDVMQAVLVPLIADPAIGVVAVAIGSSAQFFPELAVHPIVAATKAAAGTGAPIMAFPVPEATAALKLLGENAIAAARTPESCAEAIALYLLAEPPRKTVAARLPAAAEAALAQLGAEPPDEIAAGRAIEALGIARPRSLVLAPDAALPARLDLAYPLVAKLVSPDLPHKTEAGAVMLGLADRAQLEAAIAAMRARIAKERPRARIAGVLIQETARGLGEALIGMLRDPRVGPTVTLAAGGVLAEIYRDRATRLAPVDLDTARAMIAEVKGLAPLRGYRGLPPGDLDALARAIAAISTLALAPRVLEAEINPLIVGPTGQGCVAVDALLRLAPFTPP
ncbi:MAG: CoA-binding protein [Alphaproteobacteria bacterium]|nr:CoA-binding protein [Alphaproteobacteria bacterium]